MRAVGGHSVAERREGSGTPGSLVCSEDHMTGQATWPVSTGLRWPHRHVRGAGGTLPGAPGAGWAAGWQPHPLRLPAVVWVSASRAASTSFPLGQAVVPPVGLSLDACCTSVSTSHSHFPDSGHGVSDVTPGFAGWRQPVFSSPTPQLPGLHPTLLCLRGAFAQS